MDKDLNEVKKTFLKKLSSWMIENFKYVLAFAIGFVIGALIMM